MIRIAAVLFAFLLLTPTLSGARQMLTLGLPCLDVKQCTITEAEAFINEVYSRAGYDVKIVYLPMLREISEANALSTDGTFGRTPIAVRDFPNLVQVPFPTTRNVLVAATVKQGIHVRSWADLRQFRVGLIRGSRTPLLLAQQHGLYITLFNQYKSGLSMLRENRLDVIIDNAEILKNMTAAHDMQVHLSEPLYTTYGYLYFHKKHKALTPKFARILKEMLENGTSRTLLGKWATMLPTLPLETEPDILTEEKD